MVTYTDKNINFVYKVEWPEYTQTMDYSNFNSTYGITI